MRFLLLTVIFLSYFGSANANLNCIWKGTKEGVTILLTGDGSEYRQFLIDDVLDSVVGKLNRNDTSLQVLVLVNGAGFHYINTESNKFISIGVDTIDGGKNGYYFYRIFKDTYPIMQPELKIVYESYGDKPDWLEIEKLILFSVRNIDLIKRSQSNITVKNRYNYWYTFPSIDTLSIKNILGGKVPFLSPRDAFLSNTKWLIFSSIAIGLICLYVLMQKNR